MNIPRVASLLVLANLALCAGDTRAADGPAGPIKIMTTPSGVRFGLVGEKGASPAPTLILLASSIEETLGDVNFLHAGRSLAPQGYLLVSVDLPCHGQWVKPGEPAGLNGWSDRLAKGEPMIDELCQRLSALVDYLIAEHYTDPARIAVGGTSRGGFAALHFAGREKRIACVAAYAPVTDLGVLEEFRATASSPGVRAVDLTQHFEPLIGRPVWLIMGDRDERVSTDNMISYARSLSRAAYAKKLNSGVEFHIYPEPRGHRTPQPADALSAAWIAAQLKTGAGRDK